MVASLLKGQSHPQESTAELEAASRASFGDLTFLASRICEVPNSALSLMHNGSPHLFSKTGSSTCDADPFAEQLMRQGSGIFSVQDAWLDDRLAHHLEIRFYAGVAVRH